MTTIDTYEDALTKAIAKANRENNCTTYSLLDYEPPLPSHQYQYGSNPAMADQWLLSVLGPKLDPNPHQDVGPSESFPVVSEIVLGVNRQDGSISSLMALEFPEKDYFSEGYKYWYNATCIAGLSADKRRWINEVYSEKFVSLEEECQDLIPENSIQLSLFATDANHPREGHGKRLSSILRSVSDQTGLPISLMAASDTAARFYKSMGFDAHGRKDIPLGDGETTTIALMGFTPKFVGAHSQGV